MDSRQSRNLLLLALGQGLTGSIISLMTLSATLAGIRLAPSAALATLPITAAVCGAALALYSVSSLMACYGRRLAFIVGALVGAAGALLAAVGIVLAHFPLFVLAMFVLGISNAFNQYYRFAAAELAADGRSKNSAVSWVIGGGIIGGFLGPFAASRAAGVWEAYPFAGSFAVAAVISLCTALLLAGLRMPESAAAAPAGYGTEPLSGVLKSRPFLLGTASCAVGFVVMTLLMNAAPLAMHQRHFSVDSSAAVLQWHFVAMYSPAFLLAFLARKLMPAQVVMVGVLCNLLGIAVALSGATFWHFLASLILFEIGWAFMFNGGTFMLNVFSHSAHKSRLQGLNSLAIGLPNALASLSAGGLMASGGGWWLVNVAGGAVLLLTVLTFALPCLGKGRSGTF